MLSGIILSIVIAISSVLSMTSQPAEGGYKMALTGSPEDIAAVCAQVDCNTTYSSRLEATNAYLQALGRATGLNIAPIPPPTTP